MPQTENMKKEIVAQLIESGMTVEQAEATYNEQFATGNSNTALPFPRLQVNNVAGVADMGALVGDATKDDNGDVISYGINYNLEDVDFLVINRKAMYNVYDAETRKTTVKTKLMDTFTGKATFVDVLSGKTIKELIDDGVDVKYQLLMTIAIRPKGTKEDFKLYSFYAKGAILYGLNQACDALRESTPYQLLNIKTKIGKKGAVRYTEIDLDNTEVRALTKDELLGNISFLMEANNKFNEYVTAINKQYEESSDVRIEEAAEDKLPA